MPDVRRRDGACARGPAGIRREGLAVRRDPEQVPAGGFRSAEPSAGSGGRSVRGRVRGTAAAVLCQETGIGEFTL